MAFRQETKAKQGCGVHANVIKGVILTLSLAVATAYADTPRQYFNTLKENSRNFWRLKVTKTLIKQMFKS